KHWTPTTGIEHWRVASAKADHRHQRGPVRMGFLQRIFNASTREGAPGEHDSSFAKLSEEELEAHLGVVRYGDFTLTEAVRPSYDLRVVPRNGVRPDVYREGERKR